MVQGAQVITAGGTVTDRMRRGCRREQRANSCAAAVTAGLRSMLTGHRRLETSEQRCFFQHDKQLKPSRLLLPLAPHGLDMAVVLPFMRLLLSGLCCGCGGPTRGGGGPAGGWNPALLQAAAKTAPETQKRPRLGTCCLSESEMI